MRFALQAGGGTYDEFLAWARYAESRGLDGFAIPDHYLRGGPGGAALDALVTMGGLVRDTDSIELMTLVSPVTWRHPAVLAKTAATLADMSGGRFTLGVGTGWLESEHRLFGLPFPERGVRFEMMEEALGYLRAAFSEPPVDFAGKHYRFEAFEMQPRPPLRIVVGGTGTHRTPELAGRYADELNAYPAPPDVFAAKVSRARAAATAAGRDPRGLTISSAGFFIAGDTESAYRERLEAHAARSGAVVADLEESMRVRNSPHGTWDQVRARLSAMEQAGMTRFVIQTFTDDPADVEEILEKLS
jgi:alkanesulfonate monooxygenase SsuD/methylene tetrahydromethanopterin reductase-like flavin-dependent oxidoreductase (luciferase family)